MKKTVERGRKLLKKTNPGRKDDINFSLTIEKGVPIPLMKNIKGSLSNVIEEELKDKIFEMEHGDSIFIPISICDKPSTIGRLVSKMRNEIKNFESNYYIITKKVIVTPTKELYLSIQIKNIENTVEKMGYKLSPDWKVIGTRVWKKSLISKNLNK